MTLAVERDVKQQININDDKTYLNLLKIVKKVKTYIEVLLKCNEFTMFLLPTLPKIYFFLVASSPLQNFWSTIYQTCSQIEK